MDRRARLRMTGVAIFVGIAAFWWYHTWGMTGTLRIASTQVETVAILCTGNAS